MRRFLPIWMCGLFGTPFFSAIVGKSLSEGSAAASVSRDKAVAGDLIEATLALVAVRQSEGGAVDATGSDEPWRVRAHALRAEIAELVLLRRKIEDKHKEVAAASAVVRAKESAIGDLEAKVAALEKRIDATRHDSERVVALETSLIDARAKEADLQVALDALTEDLAIAERDLLAMRKKVKSLESGKRGGGERVRDDVSRVESSAAAAAVALIGENASGTASPRSPSTTVASSPALSKRATRIDLATPDGGDEEVGPIKSLRNAVRHLRAENSRLRVTWLGR
eukprot:Opistho-2@53173